MFGFPLLLIPLAVFNIIVFLMRDVGFDVRLFDLTLPSGATLKVELGDAFVTLGLLLLLLEVQKSARPGGKYLTDHLLALLIFAGAAAEFVMLPQFANATFFLLTLIALVDFLSGLALRGRRPMRVRETAIVEPAPPPVVMREPAPVVVSPEPPPFRPMDATRVDAVDIAPPMPPRVEPIVEMPEPERPNNPTRPPAAQT
jgi:hypothetical protein